MYHLPRPTRPSRLRRRERRAAARSAPAEEAAEQPTDREATAAEQAADRKLSEEDGSKQPEDNENVSDIKGNPKSAEIADAVTGSPIPQLDGNQDMFENSLKWTFVSEFHVEDIEYTLKEILPENIEATLVSRVKVVGPWSADHLCTVEMKLPGAGDQRFSWPEMSVNQADVSKDQDGVAHLYLA